MKLVNRVSIFFLGAMAVVLIAYSAALYFFVSSRLQQQFDQEMLAVLSSLVAAVEVEPEEVKWQPLEHTIGLGAAEGPDEVRWIVIGDGAQVADRSRNTTPELIEEARRIAQSYARSIDVATPLEDWAFLHKRLIAPSPDRSQRELDEFDEIVIVVARSTAPLNTELSRLAVLACALPACAWVVSAAVGQWFCRRALQPVLDMAGQARSMAGADFQSRLPVSDAGDELTDLAVAFNTLLEQQQNAFEQQRRFAGDAAHELRTPLTVLRGQIEVSLRRARSAEEYAHTLGVLRDQATELQAIVESLLFLARADEDALVAEAETISLSEWLNVYVGRWKDHPRAADIRARSDDNGDCRAQTSVALLTRLLDNLVENALKYSEAGAPVELESSCDDAGVVVTVTDHGCGIAPEDLPSIFKPFFRSPAARDGNIAGAGLGLAIAARIAEAIDASLTCESELQRGTRFALRFRRA